LDSVQKIDHGLPIVRARRGKRIDRTCCLTTVEENRVQDRRGAAVMQEMPAL
jgi:hypothetical protein